VNKHNWPLCLHFTDCGSVDLTGAGHVTLEGVCVVGSEHTAYVKTEIFLTMWLNINSSPEDPMLWSY
jgi:hypothetical protein